jgi:hypothetical protein
MNDNTSQQSITESPIIKRGPGRPRGSKNRTVNSQSDVPNPLTKMGGKRRKQSVDMDANFAELPPLEMSAEERQEVLRVVNKNTSVRLALSDPEEARVAALLIWLCAENGQKKATLLKEIVKRHLPEYFKKQRERMQKAGAFVDKISSVRTLP